MKICKDHWQLMHDAVDSRGMTDLVAKSGEAVVEDQVRQLEEAKATGTVSDKTTRDTFDPLMSMHWHFTNNALQYGGLYLMGQNPYDSEGNYCPVCEFAKHYKEFDAKKEIGDVADQMRIYCIEQKLIASPS